VPKFRDHSRKNTCSQGFNFHVCTKREARKDARKKKKVKKGIACQTRTDVDQVIFDPPMLSAKRCPRGRSKVLKGDR